MYVDYAEIGRRIAKRRKEIGLKQREVNEIADLSDKYLSNIETARSIPSVEVLMKICRALKVTPDYILLGSVTDYKDVDMSNLIYEKTKELKPEQQKFICDFIDWYKETNH